MTGPDSLHALAGATAAASRWAERIEAARFLEGWREFYLLAGTAAVTLVGLLFVSLSFNLDVLIHESKAHVLAHARATLVSFSYVLIVSLGFLVPHQSVGMLAAMVGIASLVVMVVHLIGARRRPGVQALKFEAGMRRRGRIFLIAYAVALLNAVAMLITSAPELSFNMIGVVCMILGNAMGTAWDLLVEVGKLKAEATAGGSKA